MKALIRKTVLVSENVLVEGEKSVTKPFLVVSAAAIVTNPWAGRGFVEDLQPAVLAIAPQLADILVPAAIEQIGGRDKVEAYGKAAVVGTNGEVEHGSALIHTLRFGNILRDAAGGTSFLPFTNTRGGPGCLISVPMKHKIMENEGARSHFLTAAFSVADAPGPDEIVVAIALATGGRPHHRIGDRYKDMRDMAAEAD